MDYLKTLSFSSWAWVQLLLSKSLQCVRVHSYTFNTNAISNIVWTVIVFAITTFLFKIHRFSSKFTAILSEFWWKTVILAPSYIKHSSNIVFEVIISLIIIFTSIKIWIYLFFLFRDSLNLIFYFLKLI